MSFYLIHDAEKYRDTLTDPQLLKLREEVETKTRRAWVIQQLQPPKRLFRRQPAPRFALHILTTRGWQLIRFSNGDAAGDWDVEKGAMVNYLNGVLSGIASEKWNWENDTAYAILSAAPFKPTHKHYKGGLYQVLFHCHDEATGGQKRLMAYRDDTGRIWVRDLAQFQENLPDGTPRFLPLPPNWKPEPEKTDAAAAA